jgi:peptidoglycan hydrolase CwlO-like protein
VLTQTDKKEIGDMIFTNVVDALEQVVIPKFTSLENRMDKVEGGLSNVEGRLSNVEDRLSGVERQIEILDDDMTTVKMRLTSMEKKIDNLGDNTLVVKDHEKRIKKLEQAVTV